MKKVLRTICLLLCLSYVLPSALAQITYKLELLPDQVNYQVSMISDTSWTFPYNLTSSAQVTIRVPHGTGDYRFEVKNLTSLVSGTDWDNNARIDMPEEAPEYDYISFGLLTLGTGSYEYETGVEIPMFLFANGGEYCLDSIELINNDTDPFMPPNSYGANIGNAIAVLGAGLTNAYLGNINTGRVPCTPIPACQVESTQELALCEGDSYEGIPIENDTLIRRHYISFMGCDSVASTQIMIMEPDTVEVYQIDCHAGISMPVRDTMIATYTNSSGCDSVVITYNETKPSFDTTYQVSLPEGLLYEGQSYESDTTITSYGFTSFGCDSTVTVQIVILETPTTFINTNLCEGEPFQGQIYTENTSLIDTIPLSNGVDSLVINNIIILSSYSETINISLCDGQPYQNVTYDQDTTLMETYMTDQGCDSTIITEIVVAEGFETFVEYEICAGELFEAVAYDSDTTFTQSYTTSGGCDSIVYTQLTVHEVPDAFIMGKNEICWGDHSELSVANAATYEWSTGSIQQSIEVDAAGEYAVTVTNAQGCSNEATIDFMVHQLDVAAFATPAGCNEFDLGTITFENSSPRPLLYSVTGGLGFSSSPVFENLTPGTYDLVAKDDSGCLWQEQKIVDAPQELEIYLGDDRRIQLGDSVSINTLSNATTFQNITWTPAAALSCSDCIDPMARPMESTLFSVKVVDENGCEATADIQIFVDRTPKLYVPNAFTPDGDGQNDVFLIYGGASVKEINTFRIFNRWGNLMFEKDHFLPNDPAYGWNGQFNGKEVQSGVLVYMAEVELTDGSSMIMKGEITLMR